MLTPMLGARVHINGVLVPNAEASSLREGGDGQAAPELGRAVLAPDCRIVFGRRHFFRLDVSTEHALASGKNGSRSAFSVVLLIVQRRVSLS